LKIAAGALRLIGLLAGLLVNGWAVAQTAAAPTVSAPTVSPPTVSPPLYVHAGHLLADPVDGHVLLRKTLVIEGGKVVRIEDGFTTGPNARVIDLADSFVLPGMIDGHVHLSYRDGRESLTPDSKSAAAQAIVGVTTAKLDLLAGFTTVVDLGGENEAVFALRDAANSGALEAPRILASGDYISSTPMPPPFSHHCSGADECTRVVRDQVTRGADIIKVIATGGVLSTSATGVGLQFTEEELVAIVRAAHSLGRKVMMHAHGTDGINAALRAGADSIEHGSYLDASSIALFKSHGAYLEPTLLAGDTVTRQAAAGELPPVTAAKARAVGPLMMGAARRAYLGGVKMAFGTDTGVSPHGMNAQEFPLLIKAGVTPIDAIRMATVWGADRVGMANTIGALRPGMEADLIAVKGDPLADVSVLEDVRFVMKGGTIYRQ
jgi:imidazolonepropionase-like amidohydrolase